MNQNWIKDRKRQRDEGTGQGRKETERQRHRMKGRRRQRDDGAGSRKGGDRDKASGKYRRKIQLSHMTATVQAYI